jgi:hypothetical protein
MSIYVEILIRGSLDELWRRTQVPELHQRWDVRFTEIAYLPRPDSAQPQRFLYTTRLGFGLAIQGEGETTGTRDDARGRRTSALKFWSDDPRSLIREGAGYWQYVPHDDGLTFITRYDYRTRFGVVGRLVDTLAFRPFMGWATAWSFDRLRLWIEQDLDPGSAAQRWLVHGLARVAVAFIWLYHGLVPKVLVPSPDEVVLLLNSGLPLALVPPVLTTIALAEVALGLVLLFTWWVRWPFLVAIGVLLVTTLGLALTSPTSFVAAFNPLTLNVATIVLSLIGYLTGAGLPSARRCRRTPAEPQP